MSSEANNADAGHGTGSGFVAKDPDGYNQTQRLKSIHEARRRVIEQQQKVDQARLERNISERLGNTAIRRAVEGYILELEPLMKGDETDVSEDYWSGVDLGKFQLPNGKIRAYEGVGSLLDEDELITVNWEEAVDSPLAGQSTEQKSATVQIPRGILMTAYRALNQFVSEIGLDLDLKKDETETYGFRGEVIPLEEMEFDEDEEGDEEAEDE